MFFYRNNPLGKPMMSCFLCPGKFNKLPAMRATLLVALLCPAFSAVAVEDDSAPQCNYEGNQQEMNACAYRDYEAVDKVLNEKYKALMASLPPAQQKYLRQEQRAWLKKRDPQCKAEAKDSEGGSIWPLLFYGCLQAATERRTNEFKQWEVKR